MEKIQSHGMTHQQVEDLRHHQLNNDKIKTYEPNNGGEKIKDPVFKELYGDYQVPYHEMGHYHVAMEARSWKNTGATAERTSVATVQKFTKEAYDHQLKNNAFNGYIVHIIHNPTLPGAEAATKNALAGPTTEDGDEGEEGSGDGPELSAMTVSELKDLYKHKTGEEAPAMKKADLIALIEAL